MAILIKPFTGGMQTIQFCDGVLRASSNDIPEEQLEVGTLTYASRGFKHFVKDENGVEYDLKYYNVIPHPQTKQTILISKWAVWNAYYKRYETKTMFAEANKPKCLF